MCVSLSLSRTGSFSLSLSLDFSKAFKKYADCGFSPSFPFTGGQSEGAQFEIDPRLALALYAEQLELDASAPRPKKFKRDAF